VRGEDAAADEFGLQRADEALGHRIVVGIRDRPDGCGDAQGGELLRVARSARRPSNAPA
jgi:hypothetical protein